ncbi:MAG: hypothetical protein K2K88_01150 [Muribaculaceae bacterium]|nr:hypothetical protein [Muribaculaceae bacterium]
MRNFPFKSFAAIYVAIVSIFVTSCGVTSDPETEKKLEGTWQTEYFDTEDGVKVKMTSIETYSLSDHRYDAQVGMEMTSPIYMNIGSINYTGTWKASKEMVECKIDKQSLSFKFSDLLDSSDKREFKQEFLKGLEENDYV